METSRRNHLRLLFTLTVGACSPLKVGQSQKVRLLLENAGNANTDRDRYMILKDILEAKLLDQADHVRLEQLVDLCDRWVHGKEKYADQYDGSGIGEAYLCGFFTGKVSPDKWLIQDVPKNSLLYPLSAFYQARMLIAEVIERGELSQVPTQKKYYYDQARALLKVASQAYPENELLHIYMGERKPWHLDVTEVAQAPKWATNQRKVISKLRDILTWWVEKRQTSDGQFGGGWGDDVEMWRKWMPILLAFEDQTIEAGQQNLAKGLFATDRIKNGYSNKITDVEHTAEDTGDSITAMMHIAPDDPIWAERALHLIDLMKNKWTGTNDRGYLQFKSTYFTADEIDLEPRRACDSVYHPRVIQPALLLWQRTKNEKIGDLVTAWMDTWVDATTRASKGKPAGILPSTIHWPDGEVGGTTKTWWKPGNYTDNPLYVWPSAMPMMLDTLLLTWHMTGDEKYLIPLKSMTKHFLNHREKRGVDAAPGSISWCVKKMAAFLPMALAKYRFLSNDISYDQILETYADGYLTFRMTGDRHRFGEHLSEQAQSLAFNETVFKEEVRWTDRVFTFHDAYFNDFAKNPIPSFDPTFLYQCVSGNIGSALYFPISAVRWHTPAKDLAVLVCKADTHTFEAELFHFGDDTRSMEATFYLLNAGTYQLELQTALGPSSKKEVSIGANGSRLSFNVPAQQLVKFSLVR